VQLLMRKTADMPPEPTDLTGLRPVRTVLLPDRIAAARAPLSCWGNAALT